MNILRFLPITALAAITALISSCSYNPGSTPPPSGTPLDFKKDFHGNYDIFVVDTADKDGNNGDKIVGSKISVQEIVVDTGITYPPSGGPNSKSHVARVVTFMPAPTPNDTNYFYQDPNGDLYRYNFGFKILNQFSYLTQAIGSNVDVGWVLASKMTAAAGTTWIARTDSVLIQAFNIEVFLTSQGQMMADTSFIVGTETIKARHARNIVTATAGGGAPTGESGNVVIDSYYSSDINAVVEDLFRHVTLTGSLLKQQAQGQFKIMTAHQ